VSLVCDSRPEVSAWGVELILRGAASLMDMGVCIGFHVRIITLYTMDSTDCDVILSIGLHALTDCELACVQCLEG
jgi:hypothetical protein